MTDDSKMTGQCHFTLQLQVEGAWKLVQARNHAWATALNKTTAPLPNHQLAWLCALVGREVGTTDPEYGWTILDAAYVADALIVVLLSGRVPMPRTPPLPIAELHGLLQLGTGCLPPYTTSAVATLSE